MSKLALTIQREALVGVWTALISSATGQSPLINRRPDGVNIDWRVGQAKKMENYLGNIITPKKGVGEGVASDENINVKVDLKQVLIPLVIKKTWVWVLLYTGSVVLITKLLGK